MDTNETAARNPGRPQRWSLAMQRSLLTSALLCGVPSAIVASEVMDDGDGAALSGSWDANADGKVTRDEVPMERRRFFDSVSFL